MLSAALVNPNIVKGGSRSTAGESVLLNKESTPIKSYIFRSNDKFIERKMSYFNMCNTTIYGGECVLLNKVST